jgi:2'-5' RNA ligase
MFKNRKVVLLFFLWRAEDVKSQSKSHVPHSTIGSFDLTLVQRLIEIVEPLDNYECCSNLKFVHIKIYSFCNNLHD